MKWFGKQSHAIAIKPYTFHGFERDVCMKISFRSTFLQYVTVQMVASCCSASYDNYFAAL
jgi:hypothetical protein